MSTVKKLRELLMKYRSLEIDDELIADIVKDTQEFLREDMAVILDTKR